jgi:hypothetical protein
MSRPPREPIFLIDGRDVGIFATIERAERHLEPEYLDQREEGFDALGRRLRISTDGTRVEIHLAESRPSNTRHFEDVLRHYLEWVGEDAGGKGECDLPCLVEIAQRHAIE